MERRDVLKLGAATALSAGCASSRAVSFRAVPAPPMISTAEVDGVLGDLDATLDRMAKASFTEERIASLDTLDARRSARGHNMTVRTLAAMHVAATFRELPADAQTRPDVQQRMWGMVPALDDAMLDVAHYLGSLGSADKRALQEQLRQKPSFAMDAVGVLDEHAARVGVSTRRRAQMRAIAAHTSWRMTRQSVNALVGETLDKVERVKERHARNEVMQRAIASRVAEAQLFDSRAGHAHTLFAMSVSQHEHRAHDAALVLGVGATLLGVGAVATASGIGIVSLPSSADMNNGWFGGALLITVGSLLGFAGLVTLIAGAVLAVSASDDDIDVPADEPTASHT